MEKTLDSNTKKNTVLITQEYLDLFYIRLGKANTGRRIKRVFADNPTPKDRVKYLGEGNWYDVEDENHPFSDTSHAESKTEKQKEQENTLKYKLSDSIVLHMSKIQIILEKLGGMSHFPEDTAVCIRELTDFEDGLGYYYSSFAKDLQNAHSKDSQRGVKSKFKNSMMLQLTYEQLQSFRDDIQERYTNMLRLFNTGKKVDNEQKQYLKTQKDTDELYHTAHARYQSYLSDYQMSYIHDKSVSDNQFPMGLSNISNPMTTLNRLLICNHRISYRLFNKSKIQSVLGYILAYRGDDLTDEQKENFQGLLAKVSNSAVIHNTNQMLIFRSRLIDTYDITRQKETSNGETTWVRMSHAEMKKALEDLERSS